MAARYSARINGVDCIALTKLDVLDTLAEIPVCVGYRYRGEVLRNFPADVAVLEQATPELVVLPGWQRETVGIVDEEALPPAARDYLRFIEDELAAPIGLVSTGPRREETVVRSLPVLDRLTSGAAATLPHQG